MRVEASMVMMMAEMTCNASELDSFRQGILTSGTMVDLSSKYAADYWLQAEVLSETLGSSAPFFDGLPETQYRGCPFLQLLASLLVHWKSCYLLMDTQLIHKSRPVPQPTRSSNTKECHCKRYEEELTLVSTRRSGNKCKDKKHQLVKHDSFIRGAQCPRSSETALPGAACRLQTLVCQWQT